ncbi:hypothetical protein CHGG_05839 [Chaetomium globosum CBS 148.51]|uniref:L-type lectin-like domain-containing protein n=1 Tax=Chaetomium globosum (strain ATCC 6205 / CBS 148.51 / DSM 1962 / NBRC 6347 / NRRL 1970) TaxID=306901 RepID=Q2H676_CHAGB|nr:uncharacterized protein CHGG_05839 [Chaetomium globosum CBS 148.51]EAQ89220.1 hypothetical protein CHGG_05839 [Chaetomium globosum CBS 148.51]
MLKSTLSALWLATLAWGAGKTEENNVKSIGLRTHSLAQPYLDSDMQSRWYDFGGDTIIRTDQYIRLTSDHPSQTGWLFSRVPLTATNWEIEVEFKIHGKNQLYGDGFAMWLTKGAWEGPVSFSLTSWLWSATDRNRTTRTRTARTPSLPAASLEASDTPTSRLSSVLTYFQDKNLKLELQYKSEGEWTLCFETDKPPSIPQVAYLGFSAETGELSDHHDIISIEAKNLYQSQSTSGKGTPGSSRGKKATPKESGSWTWFFMKTIFFFMVVGGGYVGYTAWRTNQKRSHRF